MSISLLEKISLILQSSRQIILASLILAQKSKQYLIEFLLDLIVKETILFISIL